MSAQDSSASRAVQLTSHALDGFELIQVPIEAPGPGQVRLAMRAASLNFRDLVMAKGMHGGLLPLIPLSDGVGVVEAVGDGVTRVKQGDRVCPIYAPGWWSGDPVAGITGQALGGDTHGVLRDHMLVAEGDVVKVPDHLSDLEAACLPVSGVTAWSALFPCGRLQPGETVLIEGTGGVSLFALALAKAAGARVAIVSSSDEKIERAKAMGAEVAVNYKSDPEWGKAIRKLTGGVELVVEVGGAATLAQAVGALSYGGRISQVGLLSGIDAQLPLRLFLPKSASIQAVLVGGRDRFEAMNRALALHQLHPVVGETFGFGQITEALQALAAQKQFGKITIDYAR
jgi:NADPH:quinone reductase-like Zn-dependent oxidoreductase